MDAGDDADFEADTDTDTDTDSGSAHPSELKAIKDRFRNEYGCWHEGFELLLEADPGFMDALTGYVTHSWREGPLSKKEKALVHLAVNATPTSLHTPGIRAHVNNAFEHGATFEEVLEVIEIVGIVGIHSLTVGVPIVEDVAGLPEDFTPEETAEHERLRAEWEERRGFWSDARRKRMIVDPGHFEHYLDISAYPWEHGVLEPRVKQLLYVAIDGTATHLFEKGLRLHVENALDRGATRAEIIEALQIANSVQVHSIRESMPILVEAAKKHDALPE